MFKRCDLTRLAKCLLSMKSSSIKQCNLKLNKILVNRVTVSLVVCINSHSNTCEPDAETSDLRTTVIVSLFTDQNGLGMAISHVTKKREKECEWVSELNQTFFAWKKMHYMNVKPT